MDNEKTELPYEDKIENITKNLGRIISQSLEKFFLEKPDWKGAISSSVIADWINGKDEKLRVDISVARVKKNENTKQLEVIE